MYPNQIPNQILSTRSKEMLRSNFHPHYQLQAINGDKAGA